MKPSLLDRLVLREMVAPLLVGALALLQLLVVMQLLQLSSVVFAAGATLRDFAEVALSLFPHFLVDALPLAFVFAVQIGLGRLTADGELLALAACGRSVTALFRVPVALAACLGLLVLGLAHYADPWGVRTLNRVLDRLIQRSLEAGLKPGVFNQSLPGFTLYAAAAQGAPAQGAPSSPRLLSGVLLEQQAPDGRDLLALARRGEVREGPSRALLLHLREGELHRLETDGESRLLFEEADVRLGLRDSIARRNRFAGATEGLFGGELRARAREMEKAGDVREGARLRFEQARRFAVPAACLSFAVLMVPLAVLYGGLPGMAYLLTLAASLFYFSFSRVGLTLAEAGVSPWLAGFLPDLCLLLSGCALTLRVGRRGLRRAGG